MVPVTKSASKAKCPVAVSELGRNSGKYWTGFPAGFQGGQKTGRQVQGAQELELADKYMERCNILPHE